MSDAGAPGINAVVRPETQAGGGPAPRAEQASAGEADAISRNQDEVRSTIAYWLVAAFVMVILFYIVVGVVGASNCGRADNCRQVADSIAVVREFLSVALASISGLVGAVTGFYFGAQTAKKAA